MEAFNSPFIIPIGAFAWPSSPSSEESGPTSTTRRIRADQRMAMLARGISIDDVEKVLGKIREEEHLPKDPLRSLSNARRTGIVLVPPASA